MARMHPLLIALALVAASPGDAAAGIADTPEIAARIAALGRPLTPELAAGTAALYEPLQAAQDRRGLRITLDQAYGPHPRHRLDVYAPENADGTQPVVLFLHGGGFVRGDKAASANIGVWFARHGVVAVVPNYRLAPEATWPSGAEDVAQALQWVGANRAAHGGDASRVVLIGNSAGSVHVADYAFRDRHRIAGDGVLGVALISPPAVDLVGRELDPARDALYYGQGDRAAQSVINALDDTDLPVLVAYAEFEPDMIMDQTRRMIAALAQRRGRLPLVTAVPGHNHLSIVQHIGTGDDAFATQLLDFVRLLVLRAS